MNPIVRKLVNFIIPEGSTRRIIARAFYRGIIKRERLELLQKSDYHELIIKYNECINNAKLDRDLRAYIAESIDKSYEKSPLYEPDEKNSFLFRDDDIKILAFYLPQYHPFPENDDFFGKGFTEWRNTTRALPLFKGHYQPRLPDELGFYDTRIKDVMKRQINMAREHGIYGFCFHHYWFCGKPVMRVPYNNILSNPDLDIPFCLNWANEPWTIKWDGFDSKEGVLIAQKHTPDDDIAFIRDIEPALQDKRYIRINGRPLLIIYRPGLFPDMCRTIDRWNEYTEKRGLGRLYLAAMQTNFDGCFESEKNIVPLDPRIYHFDAAVEYPHHCYILLDVKNSMPMLYPGFSGEIFKYPDIIKKCLAREKPPYTLFRGIMPDWDCTARRKNPIIFTNSTPELYQEWLEGNIAYTRNNLRPGEQFIFINSWNEWAEGAYMEPDRKYGFAYLNATRNAMIRSRREK